MIDNQVDPATGTVRMQGTVRERAEAGSWPGQFVNVRLLLKTPAATTPFPLRLPAGLRRKRTSTDPYDQTGEAHPRLGRPAIGDPRRDRQRAAPGQRRDHRLRQPARTAPRISRPSEAPAAASEPSAPRRRRALRRPTRARAVNISSPFIRRPIATRSWRRGPDLRACSATGACRSRACRRSISRRSRSRRGCRAPTRTRSRRSSPRRWSGSSARSRRSPSMSSQLVLRAVAGDAAVRARPRHRRAPRRTCNRPSTRPASTLPRNLPYPPTYAKVNPADAPIVTLALTSRTAAAAHAVSDLADTLLAQRLAEVSGVGQVTIQGGVRPGDPHPGRPRAPRLLRHRASRTCAPRSRRPTSRARRARSTAPRRPTRSPPTTSSRAAEAYRDVVVAYRNGAPVLLRDVATVVDGLEDARVAGWYDGEPAVILDVQRQPGANIVETVDRIRARAADARACACRPASSSRSSATAPTRSAPRSTRSSSRSSSPCAPRRAGGAAVPAHAAGDDHRRRGAAAVDRRRPSA